MFTRFSSSAPQPCLKCNKEELLALHERFRSSPSEKFWVYETTAVNCCSRCDRRDKMRLWRNYPVLRDFCCEVPYSRVQVPLTFDTVGFVERSIHSSSVSTGGSAFRAHGSFISHLVTMECDEEYKQALCAWAPKAMLDFLNGRAGSTRKKRIGQPKVEGDAPPPKDVLASIPEEEHVDLLDIDPANPDCENGLMKGTRVEADAYGKEERVTGVTAGVPDVKNLATQIGPDLIPTEVMDSCESNLKAGLAKRVKPLPFKADKIMIRKIEKTVSALMEEVFSEKKIKAWRAANPLLEEFQSKKWSSDRWRTAVDEALSECNNRIEQTFQIKNNEALPANDKAPRPIIQCGDKAQVMMALPVRCFEELLFEHFEEASIKHLPKREAMERLARRFRMDGASLIEGDGSAWDACCNSTIRKMTENRVLKKIISVLGDDPEVPKDWMDKVLKDMDKTKIRGKAKVTDNCLSPLRIVIEAIRQSGHRGTSCFNYFINLICWLCVICDEPWKMIKKDRDGNLQQWYTSPRDGKLYKVKYCFEGDDSAICSTEHFAVHQEIIEKIWTSLGFRMKLVFVKDKLTFTGFDFLCDGEGTTGTMIPEIARNLASSSWSTSSDLKSRPWARHSVGAAAFLARADNFKQCGPLSRYFAAIGLAHARKFGDRKIEEAEALSLGIAVSPSVKEALQDLYDSATAMDADMRTLVSRSFKLSPEQESRLLTVDFGDDPFDLHLARIVIPQKIWNPKNFAKPRR